MANRKANGSRSLNRIRLTEEERQESEIFYGSGQLIESDEKQLRPSTVSAPTFMNLSSYLKSPRRGTRELLKIYSDSPWLRSIVSKIGRSVAETEWTLFSSVNENGRAVLNTHLANMPYHARVKALGRAVSEGSANQIFNHPLLTLIEVGTGNPRLNGFSCVQLTASHLDLAGEAFWLVEKNALGVPETFWPIPPSWVRRLPTEQHPFYEINTDGGVIGDVPASMVIPFIDPDPSDPYQRGTGISKSLDDEIQIDEYAAKHQKSFFLNRARPDLIISGLSINPDDAKRLEHKWMSDHQGFWKSFRPLFFSNKIDVKELTQTFEAMQMVQLRKNERDTFISVFGAPPEKFGIIGESKRSTIQAADMFWLKDVIRPRVETIRRSIQAVLVPMYDERLIFDYETPVIQEDEFSYQVMRAAPWAFTVNQWQEQAGKPGFGPAGDVLLIPMNMVPVPVKDGDGKFVMPSEVSESVGGAIALRGGVENDYYQLASEVSKEVVTALSETLPELISYRAYDEE